MLTLLRVKCDMCDLSSHWTRAVPLRHQARWTSPRLKNISLWKVVITIYERKSRHQSHTSDETVWYRYRYCTTFSSTVSPEVPMTASSSPGKASPDMGCSRVRDVTERWSFFSFTAIEYSMSLHANTLPVEIRQYQWCNRYSWADRKFLPTTTIVTHNRWYKGIKQIFHIV